MNYKHLRNFPGRESSWRTYWKQRVNILPTLLLDEAVSSHGYQDGYVLETNFPMFSVIAILEMQCLLSKCSWIILKKDTLKLNLKLRKFTLEFTSMEHKKNYKKLDMNFTNFLKLVPLSRLKPDWIFSVNIFVHFKNTIIIIRVANTTLAFY